jgi:hypothetical protein
VSGELFRNGHYREAALNSYIRVVEEVKRLSRIAADGDAPSQRRQAAITVSVTFV